ncbi:amyotrophic lateral sclerosis 2 [Arctopsyche grandis]|uniref:amyotrophic lateral sclerosis 2 n=1 Tax=Arctopsyche grandis TaxID=121162 RepID=UPI00406D984C
MDHSYFWKGIKNFNLVSNERPSKITVIENEMFILSYNCNLYRVNLESPEDSLKLEKIPGVNAIDITSSNSQLLYVDTHGQVFKCDPKSCDSRQEIVVKEDAESCSHGHKTPSRKIKIKYITGGGFGVLYISDYGELWASGMMPQLNVASTTPVKVSFFEGRSVYRAEIGDNFGVIICRKSVCDDETESENEDVFVSGCAECRPNTRLSSPVSQLSIADVCPFGVQVSKSSEDTSSTSAGQSDKSGKRQTTTEDSTSSNEDSELTKIHFDESKRGDSKDPILENGIVDDVDNKLKDSTFAKNEEDKQNMIFINTEAAKQFLTKQLSWVSAGEDYLVECTEKPTRIIKENVSNLTNLVVESVKTVGDKVATLSRHMSGSSETNDAVEAYDSLITDEMNPMMYSLTSSCKLDDLQMSSSTVSDKEISQNVLNDRANVIVKTGQNLLNSEVWVWGSVNYGQLGTGDNIKRTQPILVSRLANLGIHKISCGKSHCAALSLDGRVFLWGRNLWHQVSTDTKDDKSSPQQFTANSNTDRARDITCGDNHSIVFTLNGNIFYQGKHDDVFTEKVLNLNENISYAEKSETTKEFENKNLIFGRFIKNRLDFYSCLSHDLNLSCRVLSSANVSFFYSNPKPGQETPILQDLAIEQQFLEETILVHQSLIKPLLKKSNLMGSDCKAFEKLCSNYADIMYFTAINVLSFWRYTECNKKAIEITLIQNCDEHIALYKKYLNSICDVLSINGFLQISTQIDVPNILQNLFNDKLPSNTQKNSKKIAEAVVSCSLMHPLSRLNTYKCIIQSIMRYNSTVSSSDTKTFTERRLAEVLSKWDAFNEEQEKRKREADLTRLFWESSGKTLESFKSSERRLVRESRSHPLSLQHSGRFSSHWFILLNDVLIHLNGNIQSIHSLATLWVDSVTDTDIVQNAIHLITPEETFTVTTPTSEEKSEWFQNFQNAIKINLNKFHSSQPPLIRTALYTFTNKSQLYKDAKYSGRWMNGKMHGIGKIEWPDGKNYYGSFHNNQIHGYGKMEIPNIGLYEGQWKDNLQNGFGIMKYCSGDIYEGYFKDGLAHGYGVRKQGDFTSATATVYMGDWSQGVRHGYGVMDDIGKGEKYLGSWSDNKKHGCGLIVTLDGIYYEGVFTNDMLTGHGVMIFEDGTHYEGEFRSAGVFSGKGTLTFSSGDRIEGMLSGAWTEGVKINNASLHMNVSNPALSTNSKPNSFGKLCVSPSLKWNGLFRQCLQQLGVPDYHFTSGADHFPTINSSFNNKKIWQNVAVLLSNAKNDKNVTINSLIISKNVNKSDTEQLNKIPEFGQASLTPEAYNEIKQYLNKACELSSHPIGRLVAGCAAAFCTSYGGVRVHPLLLSHAVAELGCIATRIYNVIRLLFPALPPAGEHIMLCDNINDSDDDMEDAEVVSVSGVVQPLLLPRIHSSLHVLYALHHQREDVAYWKRLLKWNRQTDVTLMAFLGIDQKFWVGYATKSVSTSPTSSPVKEQLFSEAVDTLQQLKTTFSPMEKLLVIKNTFQKMTAAVQKELGPAYLWTMDELFPVFHFVVVRAQILQLGSEIHFIEDFLEQCMQNGELGIMFTTLKACYFQILQEKVTICD